MYDNFLFVRVWPSHVIKCVHTKCITEMVTNCGQSCLLMWAIISFTWYVTNLVGPRCLLCVVWYANYYFCTFIHSWMTNWIFQEIDYAFIITFYYESLKILTVHAHNLHIMYIISCALTKGCETLQAIMLICFPRSLTVLTSMSVSCLRRIIAHPIRACLLNPTNLLCNSSVSVWNSWERFFEHAMHYTDDIDDIWYRSEFSVAIIPSE